MIDNENLVTWDFTKRNTWKENKAKLMTETSTVLYCIWLYVCGDICC